MNKKNQQGFMLVELIITSTIVVATMVTLYANFNKLYSIYKTKNNYYNIDGIYATKEMMKNLMNNNFNSFINSSVNRVAETIEPTPEPTPEPDPSQGSETDPESSPEQANPTIENNVKHYQFIIKDGVCEVTSIVANSEVCNAILGLYNVKNMIFTEYDKNDIEELKTEETNLNETFKDYLDYVINYYNIADSDTSFNYIIITELEENKTNYYSNLRIR